ncbi:MAG: NTP transferase domain-containing protein [Halobacteriales archaeon]
MCGGEGSRLDAAVEKPLLPVAGRPMVDRVLAALGASRVDTVHAVVSPRAPETRAHLDGGSRSLIEAPGEGYVADLEYALDRVERPVITAVADLPLLPGGAVDRTLDAHDGGSLSVCVPAALKRLLGVSLDTTVERDGRDLAPTGLNVVGEADGESTRRTYDARLAVNVNRRKDAEVAEELCGS